MQPNDSFYRRHGVTPPERISHGITPEQIRDQMERFKATSWHMEGNKLVAKGEMGTLVQNIPTDYICEGMDEAGLPKLRKIVL